MPLLLTQSDATLMRVADIALSAGTAARLRIDPQGWAAGTESFSLAIPCIIDEPQAFEGERVILEFTRGETLIFALTCRDSSAGSRTMRWHIAGQLPLEVPVPRARVVTAAFTYERHANDASASVVSLHVACADPSRAAIASRPLGATPLTLAPTAMGLGHQHLGLTGTKSNVRGLALLFALRAPPMGGLLLGDGRPTVLGSPTVDLRSLHFPLGSDGQRLADFCGAAAAYPQAVFLAANHSCSGRMWNGSLDCRPGTTTPSCALFDPAAASFGAYWNRSGGGTFIGVIPHVNPYAHAQLPRVPGPVNLSLQPGITAPFSNEGPIGTPTDQVSRFYRAASGFTGAGQVHVLFAANSRGVTAGGPAPIQLSDGTFVGRRLFCTYPEMGLASVPALWNGGLVGMSNLPLPTGLSSLSSLEDEAGHDEPEPLFGMDCEEERPRCWNLATGATVSVATATQRLTDSSYSRVWFGSRTATPVPGVAARFQGNGSPRLLRNGFAYRLLIRPEAGLPASDPIEAGLYILRNPRASSFWIRNESAHSQGGEALTEGPQLLVTSDLDQRNVASQRVIAYSPPVMTDDTTVVSDGWVTIMNRAGQIGPGHVGQWLEITRPNLEPRDLVCISGIDNSNPDECRVFYQGVLRNTPDVAFDIAHWLKVPSPRYRKITVALPAGPADHWRGLTAGVSGWATGSGLTLLGAHFRNPSRPGIVAGQAARSGAGFAYQHARACTAITPSLGTSPFDEMAQLLAPDVLICCTADQGDTVSFPDAARNSVGHYAGAWRDAVTSTGLSMGIVLYSTGPEFAGETQGNYREDAKASFHVAYRQASADVGAVHTSAFYDLINGAGCMNAHLTGEITESRTHPSTAFDIARMLAQLSLIVPPPCAADFNKDGGVDGSDVQAFFTAWEAGQSDADVNQDGGVDGSDVERFMRDWEAGGC